MKFFGLSLFPNPFEDERYDISQLKLQSQQQKSTLIQQNNKQIKKNQKEILEETKIPFYCQNNKTTQNGDKRQKLNEKFFIPVIEDQISESEINHYFGSECLGRYSLTFLKQQKIKEQQQIQIVENQQNNIQQSELNIQQNLPQKQPLEAVQQNQQQQPLQIKFTQSQVLNTPKEFSFIQQLNQQPNPDLRKTVQLQPQEEQKQQVQELIQREEEKKQVLVPQIPRVEEVKINFQQQTTQRQEQYQIQQSINQQLIKLYQKLNIHQVIYDQNIRQIYLSVMNPHLISKFQNTPIEIIQNQLDDIFLQLTQLMKNNPSIQMSLGAIFCEDVLDILITSLKFQIRRQLTNDKKVFSFMINFKFAKASNLEGRILYQIMVSILFKKLTFAFNNEEMNLSEFTKYQVLFQKQYYSSNPIQSSNIPVEDNNMYSLSMIRKYSILLWGLLWIDPNYFVTEEIRQSLRNNSRIKGYNKQDLQSDRKIFSELVKLFCDNCKRSPKFYQLPVLSSLWDIFSYSIYSSSPLPMNENEVQQHRQIIKSICQQCLGLLTLKNTEQRIQLENNEIRTLKSVADFLNRNPNTNPNIIKIINMELFDKCFMSQRGLLEIVQYKIQVATDLIHSDNEDYRHYDFYKDQYQIDQREKYYT